MLIGDTLHVIVIIYIYEQVRKQTHDKYFYAFSPFYFIISNFLTLVGKMYWIYKFFFRFYTSFV